MFAAKDMLLAGAAPVVPVTHDANGAGKTAHAATLAWAHTITGNAIIVGVTTINPSSSTVAITATCVVGSTNVPVLDSYVGYGALAGSFDTSLYLFGLLSPPTGAQTITITPSATAYLGGNSVSYNNVTGFGTTVKNDNGNAAATTASVVVSASSGQMISAITGNLSSSGAYSAPTQTQRYSINFVNAVNGALNIQDAAGAASVTTSVTQTSWIYRAIGVPLQ